MSDRCICGHAESMHYAVSGRCMKVVTHDPRLENHLYCTCRRYRAEQPTTDPATPGSPARGPE